MMKPLYDKAREAIEKVAAGQGFDYVLDSSTGGSVIMAKGKDLFDFIALLHRSGKADLHPSTLRDKTQSAIRARMIKPCSVGCIVQIDGPGAGFSSQAPAHSPQKSAFCGCFISCCEVCVCNGTARNGQLMVFTQTSSNGGGDLRRRGEWKSQTRRHIPLPKKRTISRCVPCSDCP